MLTRPFTHMFTQKMLHTVLQGSVPLAWVRNGSAPNAPTENKMLSTGRLTALLTSTRAHWWLVVTRVTNQWYTSVSISSLAVIAMIDARTMRQTGPSR